MNRTHQSHTSFYSKMSMDTKNKLLTALIGFVLMVGVPLFGGIAFWQEYNEPYFLLTFLPFAAILAGTKVFAPTGIGINNEKLLVFRLAGPLSYDLSKLVSAKKIENIHHEFGLTLRMWGTSGLWGSFGRFWSKKVGHFNVHITRDDTLVWLEFSDSKKVLLSPDNLDEFLEKIKK